MHIRHPGSLMNHCSRSIRTTCPPELRPPIPYLSELREQAPVLCQDLVSPEPSAATRAGEDPGSLWLSTCRRQVRG